GELRGPLARSRVRPPPHAGAFAPGGLTTDSPPRDDPDGFTAAHAWFCYAQEPLPAPSTTLPGNSQEITDRAHQRRPKNITTLIFRNYPAQACRYMAERLQAEGWYDDEASDAGEWFAEDRRPAEAGKEHRYGGGRRWSLDAWTRAFRAWHTHGERNLLLFPTQAREQNTRELAQRFATRHSTMTGAAP